MKKGGGNLLNLSKNKSGLSAIVATLIIILLVLVAIGIIWVVIRNVLESGAGTIELDQKCRDIQFRSIGAVSGGVGIYTVTLERSSSGETLAGVKLNFFNASGINSGVIEFGDEIDALGSKTATVNTATGTSVKNANRFDVTPYFLDDLGNEQLCPQTLTYSLGALGATEIGGGEGTPGTGTCGDGIIQSPNGEDPAINEQCDDGGTENGDGCSATCQEETAPTSCDGIWSLPEDEGVVCDGADVNGCNPSLCLCEPGFTAVGDGTCDLNDPLNTGTINSIWNSLYFDSNNLPKDNSVATYVSKSVNFSGSTELGCFQISYAQYVSDVDMSYLRTAVAANINAGEGYSVWEAANCGQSA